MVERHQQSIMLVYLVDLSAREDHWQTTATAQTNSKPTQIHINECFRGTGSQIVMLKGV